MALAEARAAIPDLTGDGPGDTAGDTAGDRAGDTARRRAREALRRAGDRTRPVALAGDHVVPVLAPLAPLLPGGSLRRGTSVAVDGPGATSLALALTAAASATGSWVAVVGGPSTGLLAAAELGVALERLLVVPRPPAGAWATVAATLVDAVDIVLAEAPGRVAGADARRLVARARERGAVIIRLPTRGDWPVPADVALDVTGAVWEGPAGGGAGRLVARRVEVVAGGRGAAARPRRVPLWLPGPDGRVASAGPASRRRAAG